MRNRNGMWLGLLAGVLTLITALGANAQQASPAFDDRQQSGLERQDEQMRQAGWEVMYMMDFGQMGEVWDMASQTMKNAVPREAFVGQMVADRVRLGALVERGSPSITRSSSDGSMGVPAGLYLNVMSMTRFTNQAKPVRELVSFRFDEDRIWRVTGYSLQ